MHALIDIKAEVKNVLSAKDFSKSAYQVVIFRCQSRALEYAKLSVPDPARQLELLKTRHEKGKRGGTARLRLNLV